MPEIEGLMSKETENKLGDKLKFSNRVLEIVDDPLIRIVDNKIFQPLKAKLPEEYHEVLINAIEQVVDEMEVIEI